MDRHLPASTHYSNYNVMDEQEHWDDHTRKIVNRRLEIAGAFHFFTEEEAAKMSAVCKLLTGDDREEIITYIVHHMDLTLHDGIGESERKMNVPKGKELIRSGLSALEQASRELYRQTFTDLDQNKRQQLLTELSENRGTPEHVWLGVPQKPLFTKWLNLTVEAYYSHPTVWSEIGYGGPAYPRGYVRAQLGQLDPWEAHPDKKEKGGS